MQSKVFQLVHVTIIRRNRVAIVVTLLFRLNVLPKRLLSAGKSPGLAMAPTPPTRYARVKGSMSEPSLRDHKLMAGLRVMLQSGYRRAGVSGTTFGQRLYTTRLRAQTQPQPLGNPQVPCEPGCGFRQWHLRAGRKDDNSRSHGFRVWAICRLQAKPIAPRTFFGLEPPI